MFKGGQPNPYDEIVAKATDENLTSENWEIILNLCDKVVDEGEQGARNVMAAILKRLVHRNPNVQLYALALAEALSKNCGVEVHREIASRSFTQGLEKLVTDRTAHDKVKQKTLGLIAMWTEEFENDPSLSIMEECYNNLRAKNYKFDQAPEAPPPQVDDEIRRREEEELQRVLEMSMHDKGGRQPWAGYSASSSSANAAASASTASLPSAQPARTVPAPAPAPVQTTYRTPSPAAVASPTSAAPPLSPTNAPPVTRVRALHTFEATEPGELAFEKGDIIKVVDRNYKDWWRGQLRGRTGIFPVNYVEPLPEPTTADIAREAEQEAAIFAQAANIDKLLNMLRTFDPATDNLADNEEIQELYRASMSLRPKIVKLIDKYSQKRADLVFMNESFVKARGIFDRMMEDSLARHTGLYAGRPSPSQQAGPQRQGPAPYAWNPTLYDQAGYPGVPYAAGTPGVGVPYGPGTPGAPGPYSQQPQQPPQAVAYGSQPPQQQQQQQQQPEGAVYPPQPYADPAYGAQTHVPGHGHSHSLSHPQQAYGAPQQPQVPGAPASPYAQPYAQPVGPVQPGQVQGQPYPAPQQQQQQIPQQQQPVPQQQHIPQQQQQIPQQQLVQGQDPSHAQYAGYPQQQAVPQPAQQQAPPAQVPAPVPQSGAIQPQADGRYPFVPQGEYADQNVKLWAQYYAQGGTDPAGSVYFVSVPGVTDGAPPVVAQQPPVSTEQTQPQVQSQLPVGLDPSTQQPVETPPTSYANGSTLPAEQYQAMPTSAAPYDYMQQQQQQHRPETGSPVPGYALPPASGPTAVAYDATSPPPGTSGYVHQVNNQFGAMTLQEPSAPQTV